MSSIMCNICDNYNNHCDLCGNQTRYNLHNRYDIFCSLCNAVKFPKNHYKLSLCSTQCIRLDWIPSNYTSLKNFSADVLYHMDETKCPKCKKKSASDAVFCASYVGKIKHGKRVKMEYTF